MVKKPKGVEALVAVPPPPIEEINLRDWYAAFALQALITTNHPNPTETALMLADQILKDRNDRT